MVRRQKPAWLLVGVAALGAMVSMLGAPAALAAGHGTSSSSASGTFLHGSSVLVPHRPGGVTIGTGTETATVFRDSYGVPHIYATTMAGMWFADGWVQAQDRMFQLELTRLAIEGNLSKIFGPSELSTDKAQRNFFYTPQELQQQYNALPATGQQSLQSFSAGINAYENKAFATPSSQLSMVPQEFWVVGQDLMGMSGPYKPSPWTATDTLAVGVYLARAFGSGGGSELQNLSFLQYLEAEFAKIGASSPAANAMAVFNDARWINDPTAVTTVPSTCPDGPVLTNPSQSKPNVCLPGPSSGAKTSPLAVTPSSQRQLAITAAIRSTPATAVTKAAQQLQQDKQLMLDRGNVMKVISHGGSNAFAVAPWRSADHHALLWGAPQEGFGTPSVNYEVYLHGPGYDAGGMAITGEPYVLIGRNANIAWTTTSEETYDQSVYVEHMNFSVNPPTYYYNGKWIPVQVVNESIPVLGQSTPTSYTVWRTVDGPIFSTDPAQGVAFSLDMAFWMHEYGSLVGFSQLGGDTNLTQFAHSMSKITTLHNFIYADRQGNIAYYAAGWVPQLAPINAVDPRLPKLGDGSQQFLPPIPFSQMPHSVNPGQGYLFNWNNKPSQQVYYQQNGGEEYWGTIIHALRIPQMLSASTSMNIAYLQSVEHSIGQIDNNNTRVAYPYFMPYLLGAYQKLVAEGSTLVSPATHPDLAAAMYSLETWNGHTTLGNSAMSIWVQFIQALILNVFSNGCHVAASSSCTSPDPYIGGVNFNDSSLGLGTFGGPDGMATIDLVYHILSGTSGLVPCNTLCYKGHYFQGRRAHILVQSLNDAITILSGTGPQLGHNAKGFGTPNIASWGWTPSQSINWNNLDPVLSAVGATSTCPTSAAQNRSSYFIAMDMAPDPFGYDLLPPGESGFFNAFGKPSPHLCDQVGLFNNFQYKPMPNAVPLQGGYRLVASDGGIFSFGNAKFFGSMGGKRLVKPIVDIAATPFGAGYWEVAADGGIFSFGSAKFFGSMGGKRLVKPIVAMAPAPDGMGYWEVASDGGIFSFGSAKFFGSMGGKPLNSPIVGMAPAPDGMGYWEVASDGGIFSFGSAKFFGSMGAKPLNSPIVGMAPAPNGQGYWLVAADGGVFSFGSAQFYGSMGAKTLNSPIVSIVATEDGQGYWLVAADGGVYAFGSAQYFGSVGAKRLNAPIVSGAET